MGMLAWFVNVFVAANALTPDAVLVFFIASVLALAWAVFTLFSYHRSSANARFVALVDLAFLGTLIAAVYLLRGIADVDCAAAPGLDWGPPAKPCAMLKACFALAIVDVVLFFLTALAAFNHGDHLGAYRDPRRRSSSSYRHDHHRRHHHHHLSRSPRSHAARSRSRHSSHRSSHSHTRRVYV